MVAETDYIRGYGERKRNKMPLGEGPYKRISCKYCRGGGAWAPTYEQLPPDSALHEPNCITRLSHERFLEEAEKFDEETGRMPEDSSYIPSNGPNGPCGKLPPAEDKNWYDFKRSKKRGNRGKY